MGIRDKDYVPDDVEVLVNPELIFFFAEKNRKDLETSRVLVAKNKVDGSALYITLGDDLINFQFDAVPEKDSQRPVMSFEVTDDEDCVNTFWYMIENFIRGDEEDADEEDDGEEGGESKTFGEVASSLEQNEVAERADIIDSAFDDFLRAVMDEGDIYDVEDIFYSMLEDVLSIIASYGIYVYRPEIVNGRINRYPYNDTDEETEDDDTEESDDTPEPPEDMED